MVRQDLMIRTLCLRNVHRHLHRFSHVHPTATGTRVQAAKGGETAASRATKVKLRTTKKDSGDPLMSRRIVKRAGRLVQTRQAKHRYSRVIHREAANHGRGARQTAITGVLIHLAAL